jgi:hypothetical protein
MTLYEETELDEARYLHDAVYHANRELVRKLVEANVLEKVDDPVYRIDEKAIVLKYADNLLLTDLIQQGVLVKVEEEQR